MKGINHKDIGPECTRVEWEADDAHELSNGDSFPESPSEPDFFYRNDNHKWYIYDGTDWQHMVVT